MTFGKGAAVVGGFVGAFALGVLTGPHIVDDGTVATFTHSVVSPADSPGSPSTSRRPASATRVTTRAATPVIAPSTATLHEHLKPLLNKGTDMTIASQGFRTAEQFAMVAHAARNTDVPFVLLKHRVLNERKTLVAAIRESKPEINAEIEANRAIAEARSDLARLAS